MTITSDNKIRWKNIEIGGDPSYCAETFKKIYTEDEKKEEVISPYFTKAQNDAMFPLAVEDKKILEFIKEFFIKNHVYPTPKQILDGLGLKKSVMYITRDKGKKTLSKYITFNGEHKGKRVMFVEEFTKLK
jgi:hypothetical protein